ncbi:type III secretion system stator protein SctL [uncultured Aureimonas sp.]|uniref:type III secretion system stator protein SctL n=1 Tax=uncultured Aureimonas sp. TaxID=1604662 RepID=UPI0025DFA5CE|nr:type III secretion system stator protein SctL [uncultured Aureimonas sp.]
MVGYYRLKEFGFALAGGAHVLKRAELEPVAAATALVAEAERRAVEILAGAEAAFEAERERGYRDGLAAAQIEAAERLLRENVVLDARLDRIEDDLAALVVAAVRRIFDDFDDNETALRLVRAALGQMRREHRAELRVARSQFAELRGEVDRIRADFPELQLLDIVADDTLVAPSVVVETAIGRVEADLARGLGDLEALLRGIGAGELVARSGSGAEAPPETERAA